MRQVVPKPTIESRFCAWLAVALLAALLPAWSEMVGERRNILFMGNLSESAEPTNQCQFSVEIEPVTFLLNAYKDKWKVITIKVDNRRIEPIRLSAEEDGIELVLNGGRVVKGTFQLRMQDGPAWDSLSDESRRDLAYPPSIRAAKVESRRAEVVYLFAFFPAREVTGVPHIFRYSIQKRTVTLSKPSLAAK